MQRHCTAATATHGMLLKLRCRACSGGCCPRCLCLIVRTTTHPCSRPPPPTHTHARTHAHMHARTHARTHTHARTAQVWCGVVPLGPLGVVLNSSYAHRDSQTYKCAECALASG